MSVEWEIGCSDDEKYDLREREDGRWEPEPEVILELFEKLEKDGTLEINWKCPGRRPPTPEQTESTSLGENKSAEDKPQLKDEYFDFEVEKGQIMLRPSGDVGPRGSAKKITTSLDAILSNMARHRRMDLDMMEQEVE